MKIRRAKEKDIPRMLELLVQVDMVHHRGRPDLFRGPATKFTDRELRDMLGDESRPIFVAASEEDELLAYCFCEERQIRQDPVRTDVRTLYIEDLCVDESRRGQHIGRELYDYVVDYARKGGFYNLTLNVWECNRPARSFYEGLGMKPQKTEMEMLL